MSLTNAKCHSSNVCVCLISSSNSCLDRYWCWSLVLYVDNLPHLLHRWRHVNVPCTHKNKSLVRIPFTLLSVGRTVSMCQQQCSANQSVYRWYCGRNNKCRVAGRDLSWSLRGESSSLKTMGRAHEDASAKLCVGKRKAAACRRLKNPVHPDIAVDIIRRSRQIVSERWGIFGTSRAPQSCDPGDELDLKKE